MLSEKALYVFLKAIFAQSRNRAQTVGHNTHVTFSNWNTMSLQALEKTVNKQHRCPDFKFQSNNDDGSDNYVDDCCLLVCVCAFASLRPSICRSLCMSVCLSISVMCLCVCLSMRVSVCFCLPAEHSRDRDWDPRRRWGAWGDRRWRPCAARARCGTWRWGRARWGSAGSGAYSGATARRACSVVASRWCACAWWCCCAAPT